MKENTKGPWSITAEPDDEYECFDIGRRLPSGDVEFVCSVLNEADARLIAAAQEMFEALEHIVTLFIDLKPLGSDTEREVAVVNARAALAKATGTDAKDAMS